MTLKSDSTSLIINTCLPQFFKSTVLTSLVDQRSTGEQKKRFLLSKNILFVFFKYWCQLRRPHLNVCVWVRQEHAQFRSSWKEKLFVLVVCRPEVKNRACNDSFWEFTIIYSTWWMVDGKGVGEGGADWFQSVWSSRPCDVVHIRSKKHYEPWATVRDHWMRGRVLSKSNQSLRGEDCWHCHMQGLFML